VRGYILYDVHSEGKISFKGGGARLSLTGLRGGRQYGQLSRKGEVGGGGGVREDLEEKMSG